MIPYGRQCISEDDIDAVVRVLRGDWLTTGPYVEEFEKEICRYVGCKYAVAVNSGTSALDIAIQALQISQGSEVITTPFTFAADANAVMYNGLVPVFADIEKETRNIDPQSIREKITGRTKAIIYVDYAGQPCNIDEIRKIADEHSLYLIDDACHALGAEYHGKKIGNFGDMTILSFHPVKHITTGEGGAVLTNNKELYDFLKLARTHGIDKGAYQRFCATPGWGYDMKFLGRNYRITDIQAALGTSQIKKLDSFVKRRNEIAKIYNEAFASVPEVKAPVTLRDVKHAWHIYTILLNGPKRDDVYNKIKALGIGVNVHYIPVYRLSYYKELFNIDPKFYPVTEDVFSRIITLPLYPMMSDDEVQCVIKAVKKAVI